MSSDNITISREDLDELIAAKVGEAVKTIKDDDDFIGVWRVKGKNYASRVLTSPGGEEFWINIFTNKYWKKKKHNKGERPMFNVTVNAYTPKKGKAK